MKLKTLLLALFCVLFMSGTALADSISFTAADLDAFDWRAQMEQEYGIYFSPDSGFIAAQSGFGGKYVDNSPEWWGDDNRYKGFRPTESATLYFGADTVYGIVLESLSFEKSAGTWTFTHAGGGTSVIDVTAPTPGDDFVALYGNLIDYSLGGIVSITYLPGAYPNGEFHFFEIGYSPYATPVPGAVWLMGTGLAGLLACKRRK